VGNVDIGGGMNKLKGGGGCGRKLEIKLGHHRPKDNNRLSVTGYIKSKIKIEPRPIRRP
jgi:hypothetical protein